MKIRVHTLTNKIIDISVNSNDKVKTIKDKVQETIGIPPDQQSLIFSGNLLNDEYFISDYNIIEDSLIFLVLRLRGGSKISIKDNPIEEEKRRKEEERKIFCFNFRCEYKDFCFSYDGNLTIKEMLTDFLSKINSKETPEKLIFIYNSHLLHPQIFSKKIKDYFGQKRPYYIITIRKTNQVIGGSE